MSDDRAPTLTRFDVVAIAVIIGGLALFIAGSALKTRLSEHPTPERCEALLARYVELRERSIDPKVDAAHIEAALAEARERAGAPSFAACTTEVTIEEAECVERAGYVDEAERCLR